MNKIPLIKKILPIVKSAGKIHLKYFRKDIVVDFKQNKFDPVTIADKESDVFLRNAIKRLFPDDAMLSEENSKIPKDYSGRVWMIDPLDGTKEFVAGNDCFSIVIGLCIDGILVFGIVYAPATNEYWYAQKGTGAYHIKNGKSKKIHVSKISKLKNAKMIVRNYHSNPRELDIIADKMIVNRRVSEGSMGIRLARIAMGDSDLTINTSLYCSKWDTCGAQLVLEEAGGKMSTFDGKDMDYTQSSLNWNRSFFATNGLLHKETYEEVKKTLQGIKSFKR